jgi:alpha-beta hydrolase superfamily lysophospholipase
MAERVTFSTEDGVEIAGSWWPAEGGRFALLLHMMPAAKESWEPWVPALDAAGYSALAIDLRGHGESTMGGRLDYKAFSDKQQMDKRLDVEAAFAFLKGKGASEEDTAVIGASIGANLALRFLAEHPGANVAIALSPGLDYRGVTTLDAVGRLREGQSAVMVASDDDPASFDAVRRLSGVAPSRTVPVLKSGLGHGTNMGVNDPGLIQEIVGLLP